MSNCSPDEPTKKPKPITKKNDNNSLDFFNPNSMITPGLAGGITMMITNVLVSQFNLPGSWTSLSISALLGLLVFVNDAKPLFQFVYYVMNTLIIFAMATGVNSLGKKATQEAFLFDNLVPKAMAADNSEKIYRIGFFKEWYFPAEVSSILEKFQCTRIVPVKDSFSAGDGGVRVDSTQLCISSTSGNAALVFRSSSMIGGVAYPTDRQAPWIHITLRARNGNVIRILRNFYVATVEACGGYQIHIALLPSGLNVDRIYSAETELGGSKGRPCFGPQNQVVFPRFSEQEKAYAFINK